MSISNLLDQGEVSQSWVNLRINSLQIDSDLILSPSAQNVYAALTPSPMTPVTFNATENLLSASNFSTFGPSDISPIGISYVGSNISVSATGYYLINCKIEGFINSFSVAEKFYLQFCNGASVLLQDIVYINDSSSHSLQINRLIKLEEGQTYQLKFNQDNAQLITLEGISASYLSIVKLF